MLSSLYQPPARLRTDNCRMICWQNIMLQEGTGRDAQQSWLLSLLLHV